LIILYTAIVPVARNKKLKRLITIKEPKTQSKQNV
jgi:hypothetical protein